MGFPDEGRAQAVIAILCDWAEWSAREQVTRGYPDKSVGLQSGYVSSSFEDLEDSATAQRNPIVDQCVDDLPIHQKAAIHHRYLSAVYHMRNYAYVLDEAHESLQIALRKKGVLW